MEFLKKYGILLAVVAILGLWVVSGINTIPTMDENVKAKWSEVENNYQRRNDLIPNLVSTVQGYANFEKSTLTDVINARASATKVTISAGDLSNPEVFQKYAEAQGAVSSALSRLLAVAENYPDLKANQNFMALQSQLEGTENRIAVSRKDYIDAVQEYNTRIRTFPGMLWAGIYHAQPKETFKATEGAEKPPAVKFN